MHFNYWRHGGQKNELYFANQALISKFRFFDSDDVASADAKTEIEDYLDYYTSGPLTKADMLQRIADGRDVDQRFSKHFRIGRWGKDQDEIFWQIGKIHGLENIVYLTDEQLAEAGGDPWRLQILINEANDAQKPLPPQNYDQLVLNVQKNLDQYKALIESSKHSYYPSDKKKLLGLPFQMAKRSEVPEPKRGQKEWALFTEIYEKEWDHYDNLVFDPEEKITEFNYEKFIPKQVLETMDTQS